MILYKYTADCSKLNPEQEDATKEGHESLYSRRSDIAEWNSKFYTAYRTEKKFFIMISGIRKDKMTIVAELEMEVDPGECVDYIRKILPEMELLACEEITSDEFYKEMVRTERNNWTECYIRSMKEDLKLATEPEHSYYEPVAYQVSERIYTSQNMTRQKQSEQMQEIMASESFYEEMERIYAPENEKRFVGHPVHYLITAGDKAAADDMIDILIPALLENQRLLSGRAYDVQKMTHKAEREGNFDNIFSGAKGGTVILSLEGEKSTGMYATGNYDLAKALGNKLNEYGNSTLFIFVDISGNRSVSDDTIAEILSNADLIQIQEGQGDLKRASAYLKRLAEKTEYHDYTIDELTQYLPKEKKLYSVSDIYNAYNRWYGRGLKTHIYKAYKEKDLVKIELKKKTDKPYLELQKMVGLSEVKKVTDEILAAAKMQKMRKQMGLPGVLVASPAWVLGTYFGVLFGNILPANIVSALSVGLYGMFIAIIIPPARKNHIIAGVVAISMIISCIFSYAPVISSISSGTRIIILTVIISLAAAILFPVKEENARSADNAGNADNTNATNNT